MSSVCVCVCCVCMCASVCAGICHVVLCTYVRMYVCTFSNMLCCDMTLLVCLCCRMLLNANANPGLVNNEGETPLDMTSQEEEEIIELLQNEIKKKGEGIGEKE